VSSSDFLNSSSLEELTFLPNKDEVNVILNGDKAQKQEEFPVNNELLDLCKDMLEFKNLLRSATRSSKRLLNMK
jgi:thymidine kinase